MSKDKPPVLKDAEDNVWFRLATISDDHEINRRLWNGYMGWKLSDRNKARIKDRDGKPISFPELSDEEKKRIEQHLDGEELPDPNHDAFLFRGGVDLSHTRLPFMVDFSGFIFPPYSRFGGAIFDGWVYFDEAIFIEGASFTQTAFRFLAQFQHTQFNGSVDFTDAPPSSEDDKPQEQKSIFRAVSARPHGLAKALRPIKDSSAANARPTPQLNFSNAKFGGETHFTGRHFAEPPLFFEAKLHEHTYFDEDIRHWPKAPKTQNEAWEHIKAYQRLSLLMRQQEKREDKHLFDSLEARARRVKEGRRSAFFWGSYLYQWLANYGYGLWRAVMFWLANMGLGAGLLLRPYFWGACSEALSGEVVVAALIKSLLNAHPFLVGQTIENWTNQVLCSGYGGGMIELVQGILGAIFFFFLLLTLRNRFRF